MFRLSPSVPSSLQVRQHNRLQKTFEAAIYNNLNPRPMLLLMLGSPWTVRAVHGCGGHTSAYDALLALLLKC